MLDKKVFKINVDDYAKHERLCRFVRFIGGLINIIGFWQYKCEIQGNMDNDGIKTTAKRQTFYIPRGFNCEYASRSYMLCYNALNKKIDVPEYAGSLLMQKADYESDNELVQKLYKKKAAEPEERLSREKRRIINDIVKEMSAKTALNTSNTSQKLSSVKK